MHGEFPKNGNGNSGKFNIVAEYDYRDHAGKLLFQVIRLSPKLCRASARWQRRLDLEDGHTTKVLYRLPELLAAPQATVFVAEGEKDVEALRQRLLVATCNPGGAEAAGGSKWLPTMSDSLRGRDVVIVPDNDETGEKHAANIASSLKGRRGPSASCGCLGCHQRAMSRIGWQPAEQRRSWSAWPRKYRNRTGKRNKLKRTTNAISAL